MPLLWVSQLEKLAIFLLGLFVVSEGPINRGHQKTYLHGFRRYFWKDRIEIIDPSGADMPCSVIPNLSHLNIGLVIPAKRHDRNGFDFVGQRHITQQAA